MKSITLPYQANLSAKLAAFEDLAYLLLFDSCKDQFTYPSSVQRFDFLMAEPQSLIDVTNEQQWQQFDYADGQYLPVDNAHCDLVSALQAINFKPDVAPLADIPFQGGLAGALAYNFAAQRHVATIQSNLPTAVIGLYGWCLVSDHLNKSSFLLIHPDCTNANIDDILARFHQATNERYPENRTMSELRDIHSFEEYQQKFTKVKNYIRNGDCYQINLTRQFAAPFHSNPIATYQHLRTISPTPFAGYFAASNFQLLSLSPERFIKCVDNQLETRPIKGTKPRLSDPVQDLTQQVALQNSPKDRAENVMIVDLLRNDLGKNAHIGSVKVPELFAIESYPNVHHLVSTVTATLAPNCSALGAFFDASPGGFITGAPKKRAMQIIDELEGYSREYYCGSLFYFDCFGQLDSSILIRTLTCHQGTINANAGGGIVFDSTVSAEYQESTDKIANLVHALK